MRGGRNIGFAGDRLRRGRGRGGHGAWLHLDAALRNHGFPWTVSGGVPPAQSDFRKDQLAGLVGDQGPLLGQTGSYAVAGLAGLGIGGLAIGLDAVGLLWG